LLFGEYQVFARVVNHPCKQFYKDICEGEGVCPSKRERCSIRIAVMFGKIFGTHYVVDVGENSTWYWWSVLEMRF